MPCSLTLYRQKTISTKRRTALTTQTGITHLGRPFEGTATLASGFSWVPTWMVETQQVCEFHELTVIEWWWNRVMLTTENHNSCRSQQKMMHKTLTNKHTSTVNLIQVFRFKSWIFCCNDGNSECCSHEIENHLRLHQNFQL